MTSYPPIVMHAFLIAFLKKERIEVSPPAAIAIFKVIHKQYESGLNSFAQLKYSITPILSRTREEQQKIYDLLDRLDQKTEEEFQGMGSVWATSSGSSNEQTGWQIRINRLKSWLSHNWIVVGLSLIVIVILLLIMLRPTKIDPTLNVIFPTSVVLRQPVQISAVLTDTTQQSLYRIEWLVAGKKMSNIWAFQTSFDSSGTFPVNAYLLKGDTRISESINTITVYCEPLPSVIIREVSPETLTNAPNRAAIQLRKTQAVAVSNRVGGKRRKSYEPLFTNVADDSLKFQYRWYVNDSLTGTSKRFSYLKSLDQYNTIRLVVELNETHCSVDSLPALFYEKQNIGAILARGTQPLTIPKGWNVGNILYSLFFILLLPAVIAATIYGFGIRRRRRLMSVLTTTKWEKDLPHYYDFSSAEHVIHRESGMKVVADILRKRQTSLSRRIDVPETIKFSMRSWDVPQLIFEEGSKASEYLVLLDREYPDGHLTQLFAFLCKQMQSDQINLIPYDYYKQPLLLNSQTLQHELIPVERLAALYPGSTLIIFGQSIHFVSSRKNSLKPWVIEKFRQWDKKIFITSYAASDWDKKERLLQQAGFFVLPADLDGMHVLESYLFDTVTGGQSVVATSYRSRFLPLASVRDLEQYFAGEPLLFEWIGAIAVFPVPNWQVTLRVGELIEKYYRQNGQQVVLVTYTNLLKLSRISWMQEGNWPESLKANLLATISKDLQAAVRAGLNDELARMIASLPERSVAREELTNYFRLNKFLLDAYKGQRVTEREFFAVKHLLDRDQVDAAHKIYLDRGDNSMLHYRGRPDKAATLNEFQTYTTRPAKRKQMLEVVAIMVVLAIFVLTLFAVLSSRLLQWKTTSPVNKSLSFTQQLDRPRTLYADIILGDNAERIAFSADTSILFRNIMMRDGSDQVYFRISADTNSLTVASYDSLPFEKFSDTIIAIEPRAVPVSIISSDAAGGLIADSLEQALPANFIVNRLQGASPDPSFSLAFADTSLTLEARQLQLIIRNVFQQDPPIRTLSLPDKLDGIVVYVGLRSQSQTAAPKPTKGKGRVVVPDRPTTSTNIPPDTKNPDSSGSSGRDTSAYIQLTPAIRASRFINQGRERYDAGQYRESLLYYDSAIRINPKDALPYYYSGLSNERLQYVDEALRNYETAANIDPNDLLSLYRKAEIEFSRQSYANAIQDYSRVIRINSPSSQSTVMNAYYKRGEAYRLTNNLSTACEDYQAASKLGMSQATTAFDNYCSTSNSATNQILWYDTYPSETRAMRERIQSSGIRITLADNVYAVLKDLAGKGQLIVYTISSEADLKDLNYLLETQSKYNSPFIVYYSEYATKLEKSKLRVSGKQVRVARSESELLSAIRGFLKLPDNKGYQQQKQKK